MSITEISGTLVGKSTKMLSGIYSEKRLAGGAVSDVCPAVNSPVQAFYHSSRNAEKIPGRFDEDVAGKYYNEKVYDDGRCPVIGQDPAYDKRVIHTASGFFSDEVIVGSQESHETNFVDLNRNFLEPFPIRSEALGIDSIEYPFHARGVHAEAVVGQEDGKTVRGAYVDANKGGVPKGRGFFNDTYQFGTASMGHEGMPTASYSPDGKVKFVGYYNDSDNRFVNRTGSLLHPALSGAYSAGSGTLNKSLAQKLISAFSSSSPFAQVNARAADNIIGLDETQIKHVVNDWHFVSSGSRNTGDGAVLSNNCSRQFWTSRNSPNDVIRQRDSQHNLYPPIRRAYEYNIDDVNNIEGKVEVELSQSGNDTYYIAKHKNYKDIAADQKHWTIGVDSLTTDQNQQLISPQLCEQIGDELYERNIHKFLESFKTLKFKVSSSLTPNVVNEFQIGVHPLQIVRPYEMVKFPENANLFVDPRIFPIDPFNFHNIDPLDGLDVFEPGRQQLPRIFVPEHYITGAIGGITENAQTTTYNPEWAADSEGGRVLSHWSPHSVLFSGSVASSTWLAITSSFFRPGNGRMVTDCASSLQQINVSMQPMSEINDYWERCGKCYSVAHKQTYNVASGSGGGLRVVALTASGIQSCYPFSASVTFYSCSNGLIANSVTLGPFCSTASYIEQAYLKIHRITKQLAVEEGFDAICALPDGFDSAQNYWWGIASSVYKKNVFGYGYGLDDFGPLELSTASIKTEYVAFHECVNIPHIDLSQYNTSSIRINFLTPFEFKYFLRESDDRLTNIVGYQNLFNRLSGESNYDKKKINFRTNGTFYTIVASGTLDAGNSAYPAICDVMFLNCYNRSGTKGFYENYGDTRNFPNAMVVPGVRPFREDKNLFASKSYDLTYGTLKYPSDTYASRFFGGNCFTLDENGHSPGLHAKTNVEADYNSTLYGGQVAKITSSNICGVGVEGFYGFKNYIRSEGQEHNKNFYDVMARIAADYPIWYEHDQYRSMGGNVWPKGGVLYATSFYGATDADIKKINDMAFGSMSDHLYIYYLLINSVIRNEDLMLSLFRRIPNDCYSNMFHTVFLQYPKSYATASSNITAITYSFNRSGPENLDNYGWVGIDGVTDFNNTAITFLVASESLRAAGALKQSGSNAIVFRNNDSNFLFVQDSGSIASALEVGTHIYMPEKTLGHRLTNSRGDCIVRASLTDRRIWAAGSMSLLTTDPLVVHGQGHTPGSVGHGTQFELNHRDPYIINTSRIGQACSSSTVAQFSPGLDVADGVSAASGTKGYFTTPLGPDISTQYTGAFVRRATENSFVDFSLNNNFSWIAEPPMVASQVNFWTGAVRVIATASRQELTGVCGNPYPTIYTTDHVKSDGFVNLPIINLSFAKTATDNFVSNLGINGIVNSYKGNHLSSSILYGGTGSFILGIKPGDPEIVVPRVPMNLYFRKFVIQQYLKTIPGYGDDDYIRRVNQKLCHNAGISYKTSSYECPEFAVASDAPAMLEYESGEFNYNIIDKSAVFTDVNHSSHSAVRPDQNNSHASSSFYYQKHNKAMYFGTNFGQVANMIGQPYKSRMFLGGKDYVTYYTASSGLVEPTGSLPWACNTYKV